MESLAFKVESETRDCKDCGRELPLVKFKATRLGTRAYVCNDCVAEKYRINKEAKRVIENKETAISDPMFANMQPREVIDLMSRGKRWLESRGYAITLRGEYREVKVHTIKF